MKTLKLFDAVVAKNTGSKLFISDEGYVIEADAVWAKDKILAYYAEENLSGLDLNKTFHKSWDKVRNSTRYELYLHQIMHYLSTYGTGMHGEVYIPAEELNLPEIKLKLKVVRALSRQDMTEKCLDMLRSGIALKEETVDDLLSVLVDELDYTFSGKEGIRNKEAVIKIADMYGVLPSDTMEFFRYIVYRATGESLLIKNHKMVKLVKDSTYNPGAVFKKFGLEKLAVIFNRFKPLFLAFKNKCPKVINRVAKLSKHYHRPLVQNPLNTVTSKELRNFEEHWLENATDYALFKALSACHSRIGGQDTFTYRIRNGKSYSKKLEYKKNLGVCYHNIGHLLSYFRERFSHLEGRKVFLPEDVVYALPTSEKMFVGNIPTGTKFYRDNLTVGIYWENSWGARDLDLSAVSVSGKIGWNAAYNDRNVTYSGDIINAPNGAVEYLNMNKTQNAHIVLSNIYRGNKDSEYKIIVGKGDNPSRNYMMNPNNLFLEVKCQAVQKQTILGLTLPSNVFVLLNCGLGNASVSSGSSNTLLALEGLYQQWRNPYSLNELLMELGCELVDNVEDADFDLSLDKLEKDSFVELFR